MCACSYSLCCYAQPVQSENQAESRSGNVCLHRQGAATVRLVSGDTAHRCWWTVPGKVPFRRLGIRGR